jgi:ATP-dependent DNA ligase
MADVEASPSRNDAVFVAFDLVELEGKDLRRLPIKSRKRMLSKLVRGPRPGIVLNERRAVPNIG